MPKSGSPRLTQQEQRISPSLCGWRPAPGLQVGKLLGARAPLHLPEPMPLLTTAGYLKPDFAAELLGYREVFQRNGDQVMEVSPLLATPQQRTEAIGRVCRDLAAKGVITGAFSFVPRLDPGEFLKPIPTPLEQVGVRSYTLWLAAFARSRCFCWSGRPPPSSASRRTGCT